MIDHKRKFIFLHIPKNAGTSIGNYLINQFNYSMEDFPLKKDFNYYHYDSYRIHFDNLSEDILKEYYVFTVIRNPYDRFISEYFFNSELKKLDFSLYCRKFEALWNTKYENLIKLNEKPTKPINDLAGDFYNNIHRVSQSNYLNGIYTDYIDKTPYINKIIKYENLNQDFEEVCNHLDIPNKLPHLNKSHKKQIRLSKKNKRYIYNLYKDDFINFGYSR